MQFDLLVDIPYLAFYLTNISILVFYLLKDFGKFFWFCLLFVNTFRYISKNFLSFVHLI